MKKVYALLLTVVLAIGLVAPAMAANSPTAEKAQLEKAAPASAVTTTVKGAEVKTLDVNVKKAVAEVTSNPTHLTNLGVSTSAKLASSFDLTFTGDASQGVQIPFKVSNAKAGDLAIVLHRRSDNGSWEKVGEAVLGSDLTVVGTFNNFSPVAIMLVDASQVAATGAKAPKTGEF